MIFDSITRKFQFRFKDRVTAANILGESLKDRIKEDEEQKNALVLGIPRGGIITADIVAKRLSSPFFDVVIPRKLSDIGNKEQSIGAVMEDGTTYIDQQLVNDLQIPSEYIEKEKLEQIQEIKRRSQLYRSGGGSSDSSRRSMHSQTVVLVDDGAATGATLIVSAKWVNQILLQLQQQQQESKSKRLIIAVPVAPKDTVNLLKRECNAEVEVVTSPFTFYSVSQYYESFEPVADEQVIEIMKARGLLLS
jgi:predicted phosphoribosyltransferase